MQNPLTSTSNPLADVLPVSAFWEWLFLLILVIFAIHALVIVYHWFTYGTERAVPLVAAAIYLGVGGVLLITMLTIAITI